MVAQLNKLERQFQETQESTWDEAEKTQKLEVTLKQTEGRLRSKMTRRTQVVADLDRKITEAQSLSAQLEELKTTHA